MIYVDDNLCTGCGLCVDACDRGALSIQGSTAVLDETLCTSCGRCVDTCLTGAIISAEIVAESPLSPALAQHSQAQPVWAGASSFSPTGDGAAFPTHMSPKAEPATTSKLEVVEKLVSGLFSVVTLYLERRQTGSKRSAALTFGARNKSAASGAGGTLRSAGRQARGGARVRGGGRGPGSGRGRGTGRGLGSGQGRKSRCQGR